MHRSQRKRAQQSHIQTESHRLEADVMQVFHQKNRARLRWKLFADFEGEKQPPVFEAKPADVVSYSGDGCRLRCKVSASPAPHVTWFKDGRRLLKSDHVRIERASTRDYVLALDYVTPADGGRYTVKARNCVSEVTAEALLRVEPRPLQGTALFYFLFEAALKLHLFQTNRQRSVLARRTLLASRHR